MLLSIGSGRICARPSSLLLSVTLKKEENENVEIQIVDPSLNQPTECSSSAASYDTNPIISGHVSNNSEVEVVGCEEESSIKNVEDAREDVKTVSSKPHDSDDLSNSPDVERDVYGSRWKMSPEELRPAMNGSFVDSMYCTCPITASEAPEENSANLSCMPEKAKYEEHDFDEYGKDGSTRLSGKNFVAKYKLPFHPGFLVKRKEFDCISPDDNTKNATS